MAEVGQFLRVQAGGHNRAEVLDEGLKLARAYFGDEPFEVHAVRNRTLPADVAGVTKTYYGEIFEVRFELEMWFRASSVDVDD